MPQSAEVTYPRIAPSGSSMRLNIFDRRLLDHREKQQSAMRGKKTMSEVVIADYLRTPFSRSRPKEPEKDRFNGFRMDELCARLVNRLIERTKIDPKEIGDMITGCALGVGEQWLYGGRMIPLLAGLPVEVPAMSVDRQCGSSMSALHTGTMEILTGNSDIVIAAGLEHMTHVPMSENPHFLPNLNVLKDKKYDMQTGFVMGQTAEKLFAVAKKFTRKDLDEFSLKSHQKAAKALKEGYFKGELMPVEVKTKEGSTEVVDQDLSIRPDTTLEALTQLPPVFKKTGVITAGNSSPLNAGASALMLMSRKKADEHGIKPLASVRSMGWAGVDPSIMGKGVVPASQNALKRAKLDAKDIDFWEINEAFAIVCLYAIDQLGIDQNKVNVKGGAIAIGHPLGATGARVTGTLARILKSGNGKYGLATACIGGGQGVATIIEREK
jgi:acetyl-CoA acetyltransferase family protein